MIFVSAAPAALFLHRKAKSPMGTLSSDILDAANWAIVGSLNIAPDLIYFSLDHDSPTDIPSAFVGSVDAIYRQVAGIPLI